MTQTKRHARRKIPSDGGADGTEPTPDRIDAGGESIQAAVDGASAGGVVGIGTETFREQVVIDEEVTLVGAGERETTITAPPTREVRFAHGRVRVHPIVSLEADGAAVRDDADATDPETGAVPRGRGDGVAGVRWDPYSADPFDLGSIGAGPDDPVLPNEHRGTRGELR